MRAMFLQVLGAALVVLGVAGAAGVAFGAALGAAVGVSLAGVAALVFGLSEED